MKHLLTFLLIISTLIGSAQNKDSIPDSRIFFIGFAGTTQQGYSYSGGIDYFTKTFPNAKELREFIASKNKLKSCYVTSIYEFKSRTEYREFWKNNQ